MSEETKQTDPPRPEYKSYLDIVWGQYKKYPMSYYSLFGVGLLFAIATIAPMLGHNVPFYIHIPASAGVELQGTYFPWFASLFDQNVFESGVDIFFNTLIFALPVVLLVWFGIRNIPEFEDRRDYKAFRAKYVLGATVALTIVCIFVYMQGFRQPHVDWLALAKKENVDAIFPFFPYSYRDGLMIDGMIQDGLAISWEHWLGTDGNGRDVMVRLIFGTRISLTIGVVAVGIYVTIGMILGSLAGFFGGKVDMVILRLIEVMLCFPTFFLILTIRGFIDDPSIFHIMLIIGLTGWTKVARLVRGEFLRLKNEEFVQAAEALGLKKFRIIFGHVLPNSLGPVLVAATFGVAGAILIEASLSFLGLGPTVAPSWGQILNMGRESSQMALILAPGFAIFVTVSLLNLVGEGVRDSIDPKMRK
jgi:ABC-type dipeptide/oligopeptide/nickel transport system permease subunit